MKTRPHTRALAALALAAIAAVSGACSSADEDIDASDSAVSSPATFFGDDRVGATLRGDLSKIPASYLDYEKVFKVGRECARTNSKEIFVVEEKTSRTVDGNNKSFNGVLPRAVITGCNTSGDVKDSYSLMAALISDPQVPAFEHRADKNDVMSFEPLEVMALDDKTGLMNYYVFEPTAKGKPGKVTRVFRDEKGNVLQRTLDNGSVTKDAPATSNGQPSKRCFGCHVNGAPLMNELHEPWSNWVSSRSQASRGALGGQTKSIVDEAIPNGAAPGRSGLANELEQIISQGTQRYISGDGSGNGYGPALLSGKLPGGIPQLLKSAFCQTELNYESSREVMPIELFFDGDATGAAGLVEPDAVPGLAFPFLLPVRSQFDKGAENFLGAAQILRQSTLQALRLVDDENEIFSPTRCNLLTELLPQLPPAAQLKTLADFKKLDGIVSTYLLGRLKGGKLAWASAPDLAAGAACDVTKAPDKVDAATCAPTATRQYARAHLMNELLRENVRRERSVRAYGAEVTIRFTAKKAQFDADRKPFQAIDASRKAQAAKLFNCGTRASCGPMPDLKPAK